MKCQHEDVEHVSLRAYTLTGFAAQLDIHLVFIYSFCVCARACVLNKHFTSWNGGSCIVREPKKVYGGVVVLLKFK